MSHRDRNGDRADEALDDATVEQLLAGRYEGDAADLVAVSELLGQVRSFAEHPVPPPSASLGRILGDAPPASGGELRTTSRRVLRDRQVAPFRRSAQGPQPANAARVVASIVRTLTPFGFPEQRKPETVSSEAPSPETASPSEEPTPRPGRLLAARYRGTRDERKSMGPGDGASTRSQLRSVNPAPTPANTVAAANRPTSDRVISSVPSPELALAADPDAGIAADAMPLHELVGPGTGSPGSDLLPRWYMPPPMGRSRLLQGWRRRTVFVIIAALILITAYGLCSTYGVVGFG
jgi:hypothetical protein